jgi:S1-C subfamily serine protease
VLIAGVVGGSVAEVAGLRSGDLIMEIAGRPARSLDDVRGAVQSAGAGTWLPMRVRRDGATLDLVAKFPPGAP